MYTKDIKRKVIIAKNDTRFFYDLGRHYRTLLAAHILYTIVPVCIIYRVQPSVYRVQPKTWFPD